MNEPAPISNPPDAASREEMMSAMFANMVVQQSNMALMMMGKMPHPQTGEIIQDVEAARMFIDQLEMLEFKSKGNLSKDEDRLIKQTLTGLRMAFVEAVEASATEAAPDPQAKAAPASASPSASSPSASEQAALPSDEEARRKLVKKY